MSAPEVTPESILDFWFLEAGSQKWYAVSPAFDARVRRRFAAAVEREARRYRAGRHPWRDAPESAFALIILFDQMSRNIWRGSGRAFAFDDLGRDVARHMIERGFDWAIAEDRRAFIYTPFMHSERLEDQDLCVELSKTRLIGRGTYDHACKHRDVIRKFGRFPYRNPALGRPSTDAETAYLEAGGYAPGSRKAR